MRQVAIWGLTIGARLFLDHDGDGDLDALTGGGMYANDGNGNFAPLPVPSTGTCRDAGDLDGDGDLDILGNTFSGGLFWEENDGSGVFSLGGTTNPAAGGRRLFSSCRMPPMNLAREPRLRDIDLDGDADLLYGDNGFYVYSNLSRGTYVEGISGPGHDRVVDVHGPPSEPWLLGFATETKAALKINRVGSHARALRGALRALAPGDEVLDPGSRCASRTRTGSRSTTAELRG
jgi:hypothetical protein